MSILNLFKRREKTTLEYLKENMKDLHNEDAWKQLQKQGYTMERNSKRECAFFDPDGSIIDDWSKPLTIEKMYTLRDTWARAELAEVGK